VLSTSPEEDVVHGVLFVSEQTRDVYVHCVLIVSEQTRDA